MTAEHFEALESYRIEKSFSPQWFVSLVALLYSSALSANASAARLHLHRGDAPYAGTITLNVDATDIERRILKVRESIPVAPGPLTLLYPEWLPGVHSALGPISALAGLVITANGRQIEWARDPLNVYAFHLQVPKQVPRLELEFQFVSPANSNQGRISITSDILGVQWNTVALYPAGYYSQRITVMPSLKLPEGWELASALEVSGRYASTVQFKATTLEVLVDSPVFAGRHFRRFPLTTAGGRPIYLNVVADSPDEIDAKPEHLALHRRLVEEAYAAFGLPRYDHYDFLLAISDDFGAIGLEDQRSSENGVRGGYFKNWDKNEVARSLLPHEFTHSWNGKFRSPADLWTPNFNTRMQDSLLWVYEGMTHYWGRVLSARSGLWSENTTRASIAAIAASLKEKRQGRTWRNLRDTTHQPIISSRPLPWVSWQRTEDYYGEGVLLWLAVDTRIRDLTHDARSLDDFTRAFFEVDDGRFGPATYTLQDVVRALNAVAPHDWAAFLERRLDAKTDDGLLDGIERAGWRLVFRDEPSNFSRQAEERSLDTDLSYSLGLVLDKDANLTEVVWDSPAFKARLSTAVTLVAVNGRAYKPDLLKQGIRDARSDKKPIEVLVKELDRYRTVPIDYTGGLRYPHLERIEGEPDRLSTILAPRARETAAGSGGTE